MTVVPLPLLPGRPPTPEPPAQTADATSRSVAERVATHPCYSQDAHRTYARMHLPVAPGCNIQCHYCNRKFDCSNESRPGVTTRLLSPDRAVARVQQVRERVPQLSVIGVAGPGEPLANARRTLGTLERIGEAFPDLTLCLSTNGLTLLDHVDRIADLGIDHVTVTVNMTDPEVGERIYPWITFGGRRWTGRDAARILSERQLAGIEALTSRDILCKVNSVMIPGVNDEHLVEVSRTVRELGAFLHNVMPLVSAPEHGTHFGLTGQRGPTPEELRALQDRCEALGAEGSGGSDGMAVMGMMRHCRQCRADAVGLLDEDLSQELDEPATTEAATQAATEAATQAATQAATTAAAVPGPGHGRPLRIAVATSSGVLVDQHFGHAEEFRVYDVVAGQVRLAETRQVARYCHGPTECPPGVAAPQGPEVVELLADCAAVLCSRIGTGPRRQLATRGIEAVEVYDGIEQAVARAAERVAAGGSEAHAS